MTARQKPAAPAKADPTLTQLPGKQACHKDQDA
jgi:hypothetical protein